MLEYVRYLVINRPVVVLAAIVGLTVYFLFGITLEKRPVLENSLPESNARVQEDMHLQKAFENSDYAVLALTCKGGKGCITSRSYLESVRRVSELVADSAIIAEDAIVHSLTDFRYIDADESGSVRIGNFVREMPENSKEEKSLYARLRGDNLLWGKLIAKNGRSSLLVFRLADSAGQDLVHDELQLLVDEFNSQPKTQKAGVYANHYQNRKFEIEADIEFVKYILVGFIFIGIMMSSILGWRAALSVGGAIAVSNIWSLGILGHLGYLQNVLTTSLPVILTAVVSSHGYHIMDAMITGYRDNRQNSEETRIIYGVSTALEKVSSSVFAGGMTTALGFLSLLAIPVYSLSEFGLFAAVGTLAGAFASIVMLPALTVGFFPSVITTQETSRSKYIRQKVRGFLRICMSIGTNRKQAIIAVSCTAIVCGVAMLGINELQVRSEPAHFIPEGNPARDGFDLLEDNHGGTAFVGASIDCMEDGQALSVLCLSAMEELSNYAQTQPDVVFTTSLVDRVARLYSVMKYGDILHDELPKTDAEVAQLLLFDEEAVLSELRTPEERELKLNMFIYAYDSDRIIAIRNAVEARARALESRYMGKHGFAFKTYFGDEFFVWAEMIEVIGRTGTRSIKAITLLVALFCMIHFRNLKLGVFSLLPMSVAGCLVGGLMGALGITIDIANAAIVVIVGGMTVDFYVHLVNRARIIILKSKKRIGVHQAMVGAVEEAGMPITFDCISNLSLSTLVISNFVPVQILGWLLCVAMLAAMVTTLVIVPSVTTILPNFFFKRELKQAGLRWGRSKEAAYGMAAGGS